MVKKALVCGMSLFVLLALSIPLPAQSYVTATLTGTVTDPSGAVVPGAVVTLHNNATGVNVRTVTTNRAGLYAASLLPPSTYTVTVSKSGFKDYVARSVNLHVGETRSLNVTLQTGSVHQSVTVRATATPVQTSTAAQGETITGHQITQLELNNRNFEQLVTLAPGVASSLPATVGFGIENTDSISVNGSRTSANNWTVDGADVNDTGSNLTLLNVPSVDAISEFRLQRGNYSAQYGRSSGGQVNVAIRSGTSQFHGDAYEFVRNDIFNANDFFANEGGAKKPPFRYNDFGYTLGGPLYIPGIYNTNRTKTFFFWSEEFRRTRTPGTSILNIPLPQELSGNFSGLANADGTPVTLNPASAPAGCISGNQISSSCFSKNAVAYLNNVYSKFTPNLTLPKTSTGLNQLTGEYIIPESAVDNYRQEIIRVDENLTPKIQAFAHYMQDKVPTTEPGGLFAGSGLPGISTTSTNTPGRNIVAHVTMELSPTIVNEAAFNYSWGAINSVVTGDITNPSFYGALDLSNFPYADPYGRVPGVSISGVTGVGIPVSPYHERNIDKAVYDNLTLIRGNHSIHTGFSFQFLRKSENAVNPTNGSFNFGTTYGQPAFANFLLGNASSFLQDSRDIIPNLHMANYAAYVQDNWKIRPNFTLNLGLRYALLQTPTDPARILSTFSPAAYNPANVPGIDPTTGFFLASDPVTPANYANGIILAQNACNPSLYFEPPVSPYGPTCSPYGNRVNPDFNTWAPRFGFAWDPTHDGKTAIRGGYGIYYDRSLNGIWEQNEFVNPPFLGSANAQPVAPMNNFDSPLQGAFTPLGPRTLHATGTPDFHVPYDQQWSLSVEREILPNTRLQVAYVGSKGTHLLGIFGENQVPLSVRTANPTPNANYIRPYGGYNAISAIGTGFNSNYNSLQVSVNRRVSTGLTLGAAYTWSKALTNNSTDRSSAPYNSYNFANDYGPASFDPYQIFKLSYVYNLPFYRQQKGFVGHTLGGWEVSGITTFESGFPSSIFQYYDPFNSLDYAAGTPGVYPGGIGIDPSAITPRPDRISNAANPGTVQEFINTSNYRDAIGHFGTSGRGVVTGPGMNNWDIAGIKNFRITERLHAQFRGEFFNAFNHPSFNSFEQYTDSSIFGRLTSEFEPRIIQLGLKLMF